jgi:hypothetical protein
MRRGASTSPERTATIPRTIMRRDYPQQSGVTLAMRP